MTRDEIIAKATDLIRQMQDLKKRQELEMAKLKIELDYVRAHREHPKKREYSIMGRDTGVYCPDCQQQW